MPDKSKEEINAEAKKKQNEEWTMINHSNGMCTSCKNRPAVKNGVCSECDKPYFSYV